MSRSLMDILAEYETEQAEAARDDAIAQVEANADRNWMVAAQAAVAVLAMTHDEFTTDDMWAALREVDGTHEPRAMGAVMRAAARRGLIVKTDRVVNSRRAECHARPVAIWRSLLEGRVDL
jgi:hypothetical protein